MNDEISIRFEVKEPQIAFGLFSQLSFSKRHLTKTVKPSRVLKPRQHDIPQDDLAANWDRDLGQRPNDFF